MSLRKISARDWLTNSDGLLPLDIIVPNAVSDVTVENCAPLLGVKDANQVAEPEVSVSGAVFFLAQVSL